MQETTRQLMSVQWSIELRGVGLGLQAPASQQAVTTRQHIPLAGSSSQSKAFQGTLWQGEQPGAAQATRAAKAPAQLASGAPIPH